MPRNLEIGFNILATVSKKMKNNFLNKKYNLEASNQSLIFFFCRNSDDEQQRGRGLRKLDLTSDSDEDDER